jgi:hypothetical protein
VVCQKATSLFTVVSGPCTAAGNCVMSPNFPSKYGLREKCKISAMGVTVTATSFSTEALYDKLSINGKKYHGSNGPRNVKVYSPIVWTSDFAETKSGWKLCKASQASCVDPHRTRYKVGGKPATCPQLKRWCSYKHIKQECPVTCGACR